MTQRKYSVEDIDQLREAIRNKLTFYFYDLEMQAKYAKGVGYRHNDDIDRKVEDRVRTAMLAGHKVKDLFRADERWIANTFENRKDAQTQV